MIKTFLIATTSFIMAVSWLGVADYLILEKGIIVDGVNIWLVSLGIVMNGIFFGTIITIGSKWV